MKNKYSLLIPQYMDEFNCIGNKCEDNCCHGWRVDIDKNTFEKYRSLSDKKLNHCINKYINRNRKKNSELEYGKIAMDDNGNCPFLDNDKLCMIYKNVGVEYLSKTCTMYPRITNIVNGRYEMSSYNSCPEIVRIALLNPEKMGFYLREDNIPDKTIVNLKIGNDNKNYSVFSSDHIDLIREFTIDVLQNRKYNVWERLIVLGFFFDKFHHLQEVGQHFSIDNLIEEYSNLLEDDQLSKHLKSIPVNIDIQVKLIREFNAQKILLDKNSNPKYLANLTKCLRGINCVEGESFENIVNSYYKVFNECYKPYFCEKEYILENYLVNYVFQRVFPYTNDKNFFDEYCKLVMHYSILKMMLIGVSGYHNMLSDDIVVEIIYSFSRDMEHCVQTFNKILDTYRDNGLNTFAYMAILLKN